MMAKKKKIYPEQSRRVFIGLSGGVDSAVSAALLKEKGYKVTGVFIKAWQPFDSTQGTRKFPCGWKEDRRSAMRAAAVLDIPFVTLDLGKEYKKEVVDYMIREYKAGRTPNPDVMCNKEIKFGYFLKFALKNGADFVATGHYVRKNPTSDVWNSKHRMLGYQLLEGKDKNKDQSYFLWTLTQKQLKHILFPIGNLQKAEVRKLAKKFGLPQATRKDSQGVCFLGQIDMKEFLKEYVETQKGKVLNEKGKVIGEHDGAIFYTIGERHGFRVFNQDTKSEPLYVVGKNIKKNTITVASKARKKITNGKVWPSEVLRRMTQDGSSETRGLFQEQFFSGKNTAIIEQINWIGGIPKKEIKCRLRYRQEKIKCKVSGNKVIFNEPRSDISPGQSIVFYLPTGKVDDDKICLGGGIIDKVI